ncbi:MAG: choice-of-anchor Q domain-containing protein [Rubrobacteraceae bacterium]
MLEKHSPEVGLGRLPRASSLMLAVAALLVAAIVMASLGAREARAENFVVNSLDDPGDGTCDDSECTLREAIEEANGNGESDTITFSVTGTIALTDGELQIEDDSADPDLTIDGPGTDQLTVDGDTSVRVFYIEEANATIEGLTITQGFTVAPGGGGVFNDGGTLTINDASVFDNASESSGGGIANDAGTMTINDSTVSGNFDQGSGGGVANFPGGTVEINNSTVSGNSTTGFEGGGIFNDRGTLTVNRSTISGNDSTDGGGIFTRTREPTDRDPNPTERTTITNSTISGNTANAFIIQGGNFGGGVLNERGLTIIEYTTVTDNTALPGQGSGVGTDGFRSGVARTEVGSSIIAGNTNSDVDNVFGPANAFESQGYNVIGTGNATGAFDERGDVTRVSNPRLGPLANNGGPTRTHALRSGSPALDRVARGECPPPNTDQRGVRRPQGPRCDSGSFEKKPPAPPAKANLSLTKKASKARPTVGQKLTYTLRVTNRGPDRATRVKIVDTLPKGVKVLSTSKGCRKLSARKVRCNIARLGDGRSATKKIRVKVNRAGKLVNKARASSSVRDPNPKNNRARAVVRAKAAQRFKQISCRVKDPLVRLVQGKQVVVADNKPGKSVACVIQGNQLALARALKNQNLGLVKQGGKQVRAAKGKVIKSGARRVVVRVPKGF